MNGKESATFGIEIPNPESLFIFSFKICSIMYYGCNSLG